MTIRDFMLLAGLKNSGPTMGRSPAWTTAGVVAAVLLALSGGGSQVAYAHLNAADLSRPFTKPLGAGAQLVYVSDGRNNLIDIFDRNGRQVGEITTGLNAPAGLFVDASHNLWVANGGANNVLVFPRGSTAPTQTLTDPNQPNDVTMCPDGTVYVADISGAGGIGVYPPGSTKPTRRLEAEVSDVDGFEYFVTCDTSGNVFATGLLGVSPAVGATGWTGGKQSGYHLLTWNASAGIKATSSGTLLIVGSIDNGSEPGITEFTEKGKPTGNAIGTGSAYWDDIALSRNGKFVFGAVPSLAVCDSSAFPSGAAGRQYASSNLTQPEGVAVDPGS